jgi:very-short-patch-repair endonuclease
MINKTTSKTSLLLAEKLKAKDIYLETEKFDGYKHIDIVIPKALLNIEVDGKQHFTDSSQIIRDLDRQYYSNRGGFATFHISNIVLDNYFDEVVLALVEVSKKRIERMNVRYGFWHNFIQFYKKLFNLILGKNY